MTLANFIGWCLLSSPFVALFVYIWHTDSLKLAGGIYVAGGLLGAVLWVGISLVRS